MANCEAYSDSDAILPAGLLPAENTATGTLVVGVKVYKRRWLILALFASLGFMQCAVWNTWGPITSSVIAAYPSWNDSEIALLSMWGTITMMLGLIPITTLLQTKGLRVCIVITATLMFVGTGLRCVTSEEKPFKILAHIGAIMNGFSGIAIGISPSLLSSLWFPPNERTTATSIGCTFNQLGNAGGFFFGPSIVREPHNHTGNDTHISEPHFIGRYDDIDIDTENLRRSIRDYMWLTAGVCGALFVLSLAYFPAKPKLPPSLTSAISEGPTSMKENVVLLFRNRNFLLMVLPYSLTLGINVSWCSVLDINVAPLGISQDDASWLGFYVTCGGVVIALIIARCTDMLFGYVKVTIIVNMVIATVGFTWFLLITNGTIPYSQVQLFVSVITAGSFNYACSPLFFELAVELAYPVPQGVVGGFLTVGWNLVAATFLLTMQVKKDDVLWMDYVLAIQGFVVIILMIFVKEEYRRSARDKAALTRLVDDDEEED